ncbi:alpha/beta hydrolase fold domain-containing protein [Maribellus comscasis]|uniref:Alpha/beta hydrolase fold domain-containing protein n=1 Tax=Maribellus comscasis TaxID=2681766 RepID=A0A6I6K2F3_9BACT|nr:alpha/beta hydrolase [Maribellus comscasis]QGY46687.1 alpha/beta hydrolase fold domain-containing protein [Maribellus comscasis]
MKKLAIGFFVLFLTSFQLKAQHFEVEKSVLVYKQVDGHQLEMVIYRPTKLSEIKLPAIVLFFGGGWVSGDPSHFQLQARYYASRGMVAICPDYRTKNRHKTSPFESVKDARSAMRYIKIHADELGVDTSKIVAGGGSAGGHLAACTAIIDKVNESTDDLSVSPVPKALILFNPVVDTGKKGYGQEKMDGREFALSPVHNISTGVPPTLIMHGKNDTTVPYENVVRFKQAMKQEGNKCILKGYRRQTHGFFNYSRSPRNFQKTLRRSEKFLEKLDYLKGSSWLKEYCDQIK